MQQHARKRIMILDPDEDRGQRITEAIETDGHFGYHYTDPDRAFAQVFTDPPDLIVLTAVGDRWPAFLTTLKSDNVFGHLGIMALFDPEDLKHTEDFTNIPIDDFSFLPIDMNEIRLRVKLAIAKSGRYVDSNPLSRLPGNFTILQTVQQRIDDNEPFALAHIDIDNFKPFNDRYGFSRGDEILRMAARVVVNTVRTMNRERGFVGHVGGDDFVFIVEPQMVESVCRQIIQHFDMLASTFYDDEDRMRGYIESVDRQGKPRRFPLITISIAVVDSTNHHFTHYGQYSAAANEVKKKVKQLEGSNFLVDRRQSRAEAEGEPSEPQVVH